MADNFDQQQPPDQHGFIEDRMTGRNPENWLHADASGFHGYTPEMLDEMFSAESPCLPDDFELEFDPAYLPYIATDRPEDISMETSQSGAMEFTPQVGAMGDAPQSGAVECAPQVGATGFAPQSVAMGFTPQVGAVGSATQSRAVEFAPQVGALDSASQNVAVGFAPQGGLSGEQIGVSEEGRDSYKMIIDVLGTVDQEQNAMTAHQSTTQDAAQQVQVVPAEANVGGGIPVNGPPSQDCFSQQFLASQVVPIPVVGTLGQLQGRMRSSEADMNTGPSLSVEHSDKGARKSSKKMNIQTAMKDTHAPQQQQTDPPPPELPSYHDIRVTVYYRTLKAVETTVSSPQGCLVYYNQPWDRENLSGLQQIKLPAINLIATEDVSNKQIKYTDRVIGVLEKGVRIWSDPNNGNIYATRRCRANVFWWSSVESATCKSTTEMNRDEGEERNTPILIFDYVRFKSQLKKYVVNKGVARCPMQPSVVLTFAQRWNYHDQLNTRLVYAIIEPLRAQVSLEWAAPETKPKSINLDLHTSMFEISKASQQPVA